MDENNFMEVLADTLWNEEGVSDVRTFEERGLLTRNDGLVVRLEDGSEFQVTVVQTAYLGWI